MFPIDTDTHSSKKQEVTDREYTRTKSLANLIITVSDVHLGFLFGGKRGKSTGGHHVGYRAFSLCLPWGVVNLSRFHQKTHATKAHKN